MQATYRKWFGIQCLHDYFSDGLCRVLSLRPTRECAQLLARYGCLFRPMDAGGAVYYADAGDGKFVRGYIESRPLGFTLTCGDSLLESYTDIDLSDARASPAESFYYFNNADYNAGKDSSSTRLLLSPPGAALASGPVVVKPSAFVIDFGAALGEATLSVLDSLNGQAIWERTTHKEKTSSWNLNLSDVPEGRYSLKINGKATMEFYLFHQPAINYWGLIEIFAGGSGTGDPVAEDCRLFEANGQPRECEFSVSMNARKTTWRYHIVNNSPERQHYEDYTVIGTRKNPQQSKEILFTKKKPTGGAGVETLLFESQQDIPLRQLPSHEHVFTFKPGGAGADSGRKLPYALARNTRLDAGAEAGRMYSDVFVYL